MFDRKIQEDFAVPDELNKPVMLSRNDGSPARKDARKDDGTGLVRLFHRVESASGIFEYGPNEDGEWVVEATIPSNGVNEKDHTA